jgi:hypothetical protein
VAKLESLIIDVRAETAELRKGLDEANKRLKEFDSTLKELAGVVGFKELGEMALELGKRLTEVALKGAEAAEHFVKLSQSSGIAIEDLQKLEFAAKAGGVGTDELAKGMTKLEQAVAKAAGGVIEQKALFNALGISVTGTAGKVRPLAQIIDDVTEKFAGMADGESKALLAGELLGSKNGAALIPLLNTLKESSAEAQRFGAIIDEAGIRSAAGFNENLNKLRAGLDAVATRVAAQLGPALEQLTEDLVNSGTAAETLKDLSTALVVSLKALATVVVGLAAGFEVVGSAIAAFSAEFEAVKGGDFGGALQIHADFGQQIEDTWSNTADRLKAIWDPTVKDLAETTKKIGEASKESGDKAVKAFEAGKKYLDNYKGSLEELKKLGDEEAAKVASFGLGPVDQLIAKLNSGAMTKGITNFTGELGKAHDRLIELAKQLQEMEFTKFSVELDLKLGQQFDQLLRDLATRAQAYGNVGVSSENQTQALIDQSGFKSFNDALQYYGEQVHRYQLDLADLETAKQQKDEKAIQHADQILNAQKRAVDVADGVLNAMQKQAEEEQRKTEEAWAGVRNAITGALSNIASKLGELGQVIQAGVQGFQSGGIYGALIAVVVELFSKFKRFAEIVSYGEQQVGGLIEMLSGAFSKLTDGFKEFMQMQGILTQILGDTLGPAIREAGRMFSHVAEFFAPMLNSLEILSSTLGDIVGPFQDLIDAVDPLKEIIKGVAAVFNVVSLTILGTIYGVETMFSQILKGIRDAIADLFGTDNDAWRGIYDAEHKLDIAAGEAADKINTIAKNLGDSFAAGSGVGGAPQATTFQATLFDTYMQVGNLGTAAKDTSAALAKMTEELTNVPQGFKYALEKFNATQATGGSGGAYSFGNPTVPVVQLTVQGTVVTEQNLISAVRKGLQVSNFRNNGVPHFP